MSKSKDTRRLTTTDIRARKGSDSPLVCLTAYTAPVTQILDRHCDLLLVGDSLGMVVYGMDSTLSVTLDMMINHGKAVVRASEKAHVIVDLPFGSYQESPEAAFRTAARVLAETGCGSVKLEGGQEMAPTIEFLTRRGIPVVAHVGLLPQSVNQQGGFRVRGRDAAEAARIMNDARAAEQSGAFACVIEGVLEPVARAVTEEINIPTIGIGASSACDGQVLVTEDLLGLFTDFTPKFVKKYAALSGAIDQAAGNFAADVRARKFPAGEHVFAGTTKKSAVNED